VVAFALAARSWTPLTLRRCRALLTHPQSVAFELRSAP
jgi:hypothetical protein